ncbi:MAG: rod shape-determining protein RodA [Sneathiella sp.]|nr:rod shape-determining protein RodA [Sneathiella sp.]
MLRELGAPERNLPLSKKIWDINWGYVLLICATASVGFVMLYSAADGNLDPWASRQMIRFAAGLVVMFVVALIDIRIWIRLAYPLYAIALLMLVSVEVMGVVGMGAKRWVDIGPIQLQPSEIMKITLVMAVARYFHGLALEDIGRIRYLIPPLILVAMPAALVLRQPDLGTTLLLVAGTGIVFFVAGVRLWKFALLFGSAVPSAFVAYQYLHEYQQKRIFIFLNPESDPLGAGYHIMQSKIALGSGGIFGKGLVQGTQSHLNYLPEMRTDFIFSMLAEEFGMVGGLILFALYILLMAYGYAIALRSRNQFGRLLAVGMTGVFFLYVFINIAMVMGLVPVVGVPLPLISYGGTSMLTLLVGFGLIMSVYLHRDVEIPTNKYCFSSYWRCLITCSSFHCELGRDVFHDRVSVSGDLTMRIYASTIIGAFLGLVSPLELIAEPVIGTADILSGEVLVVNGKSFRLYGIDAPEKGQLCKNKVGKSFDCGRIAATGLMDLTVGAEVHCEAASDSQTVPIIATCSAGGYDLSEGMVYTGWALPDPQTGALLERFQMQAKSKKHGLWAGEFDPPWIWRAQQPQ